MSRRLIDVVILDSWRDDVASACKVIYVVPNKGHCMLVGLLDDDDERRCTWSRVGSIASHEGAGLWDYEG